MVQKYGVIFSEPYRTPPGGLIKRLALLKPSHTKFQLHCCNKIASLKHKIYLVSERLTLLEFIDLEPEDWVLYKISVRLNFEEKYGTKLRTVF